MDIREILKNVKEIDYEQEYIKCKESPYYFATNYLYVEGVDGVKQKFTTIYSEEEFNSLCIPTLVRKRRK